MTVVGKILVFVNLVFSLAVGGLILVVYVARTNWADAYQKLNQRYQAVVVEADNSRIEIAEARNKADAEVARYKAEKATLETALQDKDRAIADVKAQFALLKQGSDKAEGTVAASTAQAQGRQEEVKHLQSQVKERDARVNQLVTDNNKYREEAVAAKIESNNLKNRNTQLVDQLETMTRTMVRLQQSGGAAGTAATPAAVPSSLSTRNPPPENVEGLIMQTDPSGLVTISIGSDAGLNKGHTLEVFRLNPAKYLGTIRIQEVTPHRAVGKPVSRPLGTLQQGDRVSSKILGS